MNQKRREEAANTTLATSLREAPAKEPIINGA